MARWRSASLIDPAALVTESVPVASARKFTEYPRWNALPRRGVAAHLSHVPGNSDGGDVLCLQPVLKGCTSEAAGEVFLNDNVSMAAPDLIMELPAGRPFPERRRLRRKVRMLDDNNGQVGRMGPVHGLQDILKTPIRVRYRKFS